MSIEQAVEEETLLVDFTDYTAYKICGVVIAQKFEDPKQIQVNAIICEGISTLRGFAHKFNVLYPDYSIIIHRRKGENAGKERHYAGQTEKFIKKLINQRPINYRKG